MNIYPPMDSTINRNATNIPVTLADAGNFQFFSFSPLIGYTPMILAGKSLDLVNCTHAS